MLYESGLVFFDRVIEAVSIFVCLDESVEGCNKGNLVQIPIFTKY